MSDDQHVGEATLPTDGPAAMDAFKREAPLLSRRNAFEREMLASDVRLVWGQALEWFDLAVVTADRLGQNMQHSHRGLEADDDLHLFNILIRLYAGACLVAREIGDLLRAGHASGARGRWRTLHEHAVIMRFLQQQGPDMARRYWDHGDVEGAKLSEEIQRGRKLRHLEPLDEAKVRREQERRQQLVDENPGFGQDYGWARPGLPANSNATFRTIEEAVGMRDDFRWLYRMASWRVHPSVHGVRFDDALWRYDGLRSVPVNAGIWQPAEITLVSLGFCAEDLVSIDPQPEWQTQLELLASLIRTATKFFATTERTARDRLDLGSRAGTPLPPAETDDLSK